MKTALIIYFILAFLMAIFHMGTKYGKMKFEKKGAEFPVSAYSISNFSLRFILLFPLILHLTIGAHYRLFDFFKIKKDLPKISTPVLKELKDRIQNDAKRQIKFGKNYLCSFVLKNLHLRIINKELKKRGESFENKSDNTEQDGKNINLTW